MKRLLTLTLFLGLVWGQKKLHGYWHSMSSAAASVVYVRKIYESNGRQFSEYSFYSKNPIPYTKGEWDYGPWTEKTENKSTKILSDPCYGESYTERTIKDQTIKTEYILIDKNTLLIGESKYTRGFPDFLPKFDIFRY